MSSQAVKDSKKAVINGFFFYETNNNREIGNLLGVDYSTVSQGRKRLRDKAEKDKEIRSVLENINKELSRIKI